MAAFARLLTVASVYTRQVFALQVAYNFTLPYESTNQENGLTYDVKVWTDAKHGRYRMDTYAGTNSLIATKVSRYQQVVV